MGRKRWVGCVVLGMALAGAPAGVWSAPPAAGTAGKGPTSAPAARAKASLEPLIQSGLDALAAGQVQAAREAFQDAITVDPRSGRAHHGLAMCFLETKELPKAKEAIERALVNTPRPDRSLALNGASLALQTKNTMRAAKLAKDYLSANPKELDEVMVNALGTALDKATASERKNRFFSECAAYYEIANKRLEGARPGYKRFGIEWMPAAEADKKLAAIAAQQKQLDTLQNDIATADELFRVAEKEYERQKFLLTRGEPPGNYYFRQAESAYESAKGRLETAKTSYEQAVAGLERPKFAPEIGTVAVEDRTVPPLTAPTAVATNVGGGTTGAGGNTFEVKPKPAPVKPPRPKTTGQELTDDDMAGKTGTGTIGGGGNTGIPAEPPRPRKLRITQYAAAFPVGPDLVVTSAAAIADGATLRLQASDGTSLSAEVVKKDEATGLALLKVTGRTLAALPLADAFNGGAVTCPSFPSVDLFSPAAQSIAGTSRAPGGDGAWTVSLNLHPRLAGAPLLSGGKVVGVCVAPRDAEKTKLPAVTLERLKAFVGDGAKGGNRIGDPVASLLQLVTTRESGTGE